MRKVSIEFTPWLFLDAPMYSWIITPEHPEPRLCMKSNAQAWSFADKHGFIREYPFKMGAQRVVWVLVETNEAADVDVGSMEELKEKLKPLMEDG